MGLIDMLDASIAAWFYPFQARKVTKSERVGSTSRTWPCLKSERVLYRVLARRLFRAPK